MGNSREIREIDPFRADAAVVYRYIRDHPGASAPEIADVCFPTQFGESDPAYHALLKRSLRRVFDSIVWMRHQNVDIWAIPGVLGLTTYSLTQNTPVTAKVSQGSDVMTLYHPTE